MGLNLDRDESAMAVFDTVMRYGASLDEDAPFEQRWTGLADLGFFSVPQDFEEVANAAVVAGMEALGRQGFFGPVADTITFSACAPDGLIAPVVSGKLVAVLCQPPLSPFPETQAVHVVELDGEAVQFVIARAEPVPMLSGDPWARVEGAPGRKLGPFAPWRDRYDLAVSAWMVGAGLRLIEDAAAHAAQRVQFGRPIGDFQAVSAPLARAVRSLDAARILTDAAATKHDRGDGHLIAAARISATRAAKAAAITAHQTYGAMGVVVEGPVCSRSRRIRQLASQFPAPRALDAMSTLGARALGLVG